MTPTPQVECFGRESVCERLIRAEHEDGAAFLFGGPLAGKTTVLRRTHDMLAAKLSGNQNFTTAVIPVLVELRQLGDDFTPPGFYQLLATNATNAVSSALSNRLKSLAGDATPTVGGFGGFVGFLAGLLESWGGCQPRLYFLLDDCKRLTCFSRGFQDNLVHLLWGTRHAVSGKVAMAFSGAQELYSFFLDPTTPLRTRSVIIFLENLQKLGVAEMASAPGLKEQSELVAEVFRITGGHAGLSRSILKRLGSMALEVGTTLEGAVTEFCSGKQDLMRQWNESLSPEAKCLATILTGGAPVSRSSAANALRAAGHDPAFNIRAFDELVFTGMAVRDGTDVRKAGRIFWDFLRTVEAGVSTSNSRPLGLGSRFVFKRVNRSWWFRFNGEDYGDAHKQLDGFRYIAFLLRRKAEPTHCVELRLNCKQPSDDTARRQLEQLLNDVKRGYGPKQKYARTDTKIEWQKAIEQLDGLITEARAADDPLKAEELEGQKERLQKERDKQIGLGGRLRPETTQEVLEDRTRKAVGKAMKEAIAYLKTNCPKLGEHLEHDTQGIECFSNWPQYRGQNDWDTEEVATREVAKR